MTTVTVIFQPGALVQQAGESQVTFAERVVDALRQKAMAQSGDTLQLGFN